VFSVPRRSLALLTALAVSAVGSLVFASPALAADSTRPTVTLEAPASNFVFSGDTVTVSATDDSGLARLAATLYNASGLVAVVGTASASGTSGSASWTLPALADGDYELRIGANDAAGNNATVRTSVIVDTVAPDVTISTPSPGLVVAPGTIIPLVGSISEAHPFRTYVAVQGVDSDIDETGLTSVSRSIDTTGFASGTYIAQIEARDAAGNKDSGSIAKVTFTVDADAPDVVITSPAAGSFVKPGAVLDFTATISDANPSIYYSQLDGVGLEYGSSSSLTNYATTVDTTGWADGSVHVFKFEARDAFNQKDAGSTAVVRVRADALAPVVTFTAPSSGDLVAGTLTVSGTVADAGSGVNSLDVRVRAADPVTGVCNGTAVKFDVPFAPDGAWSIDIDTSVFPDGEYCIIAHAEDAVGNGNGQSTRLREIEFDNTAPATPTVAFPTGYTLEASEFRWYPVTDPNGVRYEVVLGRGPNTTDGRLNDGVTIGSDLTGTTLAYDIPTGPLRWQVRAIDDLGNASAWSSGTGAQIIGIPEIITPTTGYTFSETSLTATWTAVFGIGGVDHYEVEYGVDGDGDGTLEYEYVDVPGTAWTAGATVSHTQSFSAGYEGPLSIRVRAVYNIPYRASDPSSVNGPWSAPVVHYTRDATAPTIQIDEPLDGAIFSPRESIDVTVTAADAGALNRIGVNLFDEDSTAFIQAIGSTSGLSALGTNAETRTWTIPAGLAEGTYTIRANVTDTAGLRGVHVIQFVVDGTRPAITIDSPELDEPFRGSATIPVTLTGTDEVALKRLDVNLYDATNSTFITNVGTTGGASALGTTSETRTWDLPVAGLAEGVYTLRASAHDVAGNVKTTSSTFVVDLTRPTIAIDAPLDGAEFNGEVIVEISGADEIGLARLVANLYDESGSVFLGPIGSTSGLTSLGTTSDSASWTIPAGLADGTYTIRAAARDLAGNVQTTASTFIIATAAEPVAGSAGGPTLAPTTSGGDGDAPAPTGAGGAPHTDGPEVALTTLALDDGAASEADDTAGAGSGDDTAELATSAAPMGFDWWWLILLALLLAGVVGYWRIRVAQRA